MPSWAMVGVRVRLDEFHSGLIRNQPGACRQWEAPVTNDEALALYRRVANGDERAFRALYVEFYPTVYRTAKFKLRNSPNNLIDEVVSDAMSDFWYASKKFKGDSKVSVWLIGILKNKLLEAWRKLRREPETKDFDDDLTRDALSVLLENEMSSTVDAIELIAAAQDGAAIDRCMSKLSERHRDVIRLVLVDGMSRNDVASILNEPVATIKTRFFYGIRALRACLGGTSGMNPRGA